jgi:hypothetical protein
MIFVVQLGPRDTQVCIKTSLLTGYMIINMLLHFSEFQNPYQKNRDNTYNEDFCELAGGI